MRRNTWTSYDQTWASLNPYERAAVMSLMEANGMDVTQAKHALGAMLNRSQLSGEDLGEHVSKPIYQPTIEPAQQRRLKNILGSEQYPELVKAAELGDFPERGELGGATHFLAPESTMVALTRQNPRKYRSWPKWTGYDQGTGEYKGVTFRDKGHAFLAPEGKYEGPHSAAFAANFDAAGVDGAPGTPSGPAVTKEMAAADPVGAFAPAKPPEMPKPMRGLPGGLAPIKTTPPPMVADAGGDNTFASVMKGLGGFSGLMGGGGGGGENKEADPDPAGLMKEAQTAQDAALKTVLERIMAKRKERMMG